MGADKRVVSSPIVDVDTKDAIVFRVGPFMIRKGLSRGPETWQAIVVDPDFKGFNDGGSSVYAERKHGR